MPLGESDTRAKLIDPALHARGWTEDLIRREETAGAVEVIEGQPRNPAQGEEASCGILQVPNRTPGAWRMHLTPVCEL